MPENNIEGNPPILGSWKLVYIAVIAFLLLQIIVYSIITELLK